MTNTVDGSSTIVFLFSCKSPSQNMTDVNNINTTHEKTNRYNFDDQCDVFFYYGEVACQTGVTSKRQRNSRRQPEGGLQS